eukprot:832253-Pelagomonas_calceolata.AAC.1
MHAVWQGRMCGRGRGELAACMQCGRAEDVRGESVTWWGGVHKHCACSGVAAGLGVQQGWECACCVARQDSDRMGGLAACVQCSKGSSYRVRNHFIQLLTA